MKNPTVKKYFGARGRAPLISVAIFLLVFSSAAHSSKFGKIKTKSVTLERNTYITVDIAPDLGVLFDFPLTKAEIEGNFYIEKINSRFFQHTALENISDNDNSFSFNLNSEAYGQALASVDDIDQLVILSDIFIKYGQYNIFVRARATDDPNKHVSHIKFKLSDKDQRSWIEKEKAKLNLNFKNQLQQAKAEFDAKVQSSIRDGLLSELIIDFDEVSIGAFEKNEKLSIDIETYIELKSYTLYQFEIDNYSEAGIDLISILATDKNNKNIPVFFEKITAHFDTTQKAFFAIEGKHQEGVIFMFKTTNGEIKINV